MRTPILAALVLAAACGDAAPPGFSTGPAVTSLSASTSGSSSTGDTSSTGPADDSAGSSGSSSTGIVRDVGTAMDFGPVQPPGCKGKVDFLFVISRQGTMVNEQTQLLASFPDFIDTIEQTLEGFDVHIMTPNPDAYWPGWTCENRHEDAAQNRVGPRVVLSLAHADDPRDVASDTAGGAVQSAPPLPPPTRPVLTSAPPICLRFAS